MKKTDKDSIDCVVNLMLEARTNAGISKDTAIAATEGMSKLRSKYRTLPSIPTEIANMLIDMQASLLTSAERHKSDLANVAMANTIFEIALRLSDIAREMTSLSK